MRPNLQKCGRRRRASLLQDFLQWGALSRIVGRQVLTQPGALVRMTLFMRSPVAGQMLAANMAMLLAYDVLFRVARAVAPVHERLLPPKLLYRWRRLVSSLSRLVAGTDCQLGRDLGTVHARPPCRPARHASLPCCGGCWLQDGTRGYCCGDVW